VFKNRDLKDLLIVDNAVYSFGAQLSNGIPITPFKDDKEDREFILLMNYLKMIKDKSDFRVQNKKYFKMEQVYKFDLNNFIQYYDDDSIYQLSDEEDDEGANEDDEHKNQDEKGAVKRCFSETLQMQSEGDNHTNG
jgi:NLI interacting factor-like phosphatase